MNNSNCDKESDVGENYDDNKTVQKDGEKIISNEHSEETTSRETEVQKD